MSRAETGVKTRAMMRNNNRNVRGYRNAIKKEGENKVNR